MTVVEDELEFLLRSENRTGLLVALREGQPLDRYDLETRLDASRRTVSRALDALTERGYIAESEAGYALTAYGATMVDAYRDALHRGQVAEQYRPLLEHLDTRTFDLDPALLEGAELTVAGEASPFALLNRTLELREGASRVREVAPGIEKASVEQLGQRVRDKEEFEMEVVLPPGAVDAVEEDADFGKDHITARESSAVDFYVTDGPVRTFVGVMDDTVALATGVDGQPEALVESDDPELRAWAEARIDEIRDAATPLPEY